VRLGLSVGALMAGMGAAVMDATDWDLLSTVAETKSFLRSLLFCEEDAGIML